LSNPERPTLAEIAGPALILMLVFLSVLVFTNPQGEFPLNDDWSYGQAVQNLVQNHEYRLTNWTSMPLLTQVLWGALFSIPAGFSHFALRLSTLVLSLAGILLLLRLVHCGGTRRPEVLLLGPLCLLFNPVYLDLSHTFMTDVPYLTLTMGSVLLLVLGTDRDNKLMLALGMCAAVLATLLRQTGVLIPLAYGIACLTGRRVKAGGSLLAAGFLIVTVVALVVYTQWLTVTGRLPTGFHAQQSQVTSVLVSGLPAVARQVTVSLLTTFTYLGLFALPLGLLFTAGARWRRLFAFLGVSAALLGLTQVLHIGFPGNILSDRGVGPFTLAHTEQFSAFTGSAASKAVLGLLSLVGGALLLETLVRSARHFRTSWPTALCLSLAGLSFLSLSLVHQFDRYMLIYLPLIVVAAAAEFYRNPPRRFAVVAAYAVLLAYAGFSVGAVHDYLSWNRTRWLAIRHLMSDLSVPADRLDGGFEFNGLYTYAEEYVRVPGKSPWWVKDDEYVIAYDVLPGYDVLQVYPVKSWLPSGIRSIQVLRRSARTPPGG